MSDAAGLIAGKKFLVVDDEELVREVTTMMIEDAGGVVYTASDGAEAVEKFRIHHHELAAVFMDFSMPRLTGFQAFEQLEKINPKVAVILVSGLKITPEAEEARTAGRLAFLGKPFKQDDVTSILAKVIAAKG